MTQEELSTGGASPKLGQLERRAIEQRHSQLSMRAFTNQPDSPEIDAGVLGRHDRARTHVTETEELVHPREEHNEDGS
jgi:hypothetical protein